LSHPHHGQDHGPHGHSHGIGDRGDWQVAAAVAVNLGLTVAQIVGGLIAGSFAARRIARRPATPAMSFGYGRAEIVAALVNYTTLIVISVWLGYEAVARLVDPPPVQGWIVVALAGLALVIDLVTALLTWRLSRFSVNIRAAFLHNLSDAGTSLAVIIGGGLILLYDWRLVDPLLTLAISVWIAWHALREVGPVIRILMLGAPADLESAEIAEAIRAEAGVAGLHHVHLWQIDERRSSIEAHLVIGDGADAAEVLARVKAMVARRFGLDHSTFEVERSGAPRGARGCA
jgi:cobalt-zinc-cadmium efflux system protein